MKKENSSVIREGFYIALIIFLLSLVSLVLGFILVSTVLCLLALFVLFFFRNPEREIPVEEDTVVSPADGRVVDVRKIKEDQYFHKEMICISIFLSIFNVHVNRSPYSGKVESVKYTKGKFLPAFREKASLLNEQNAIVISYKDVGILVKQIAGIIARRVVCWVKEGDQLERGQHLGLIRFGSRVDIFLPVDVQIEVSVGDKIKGGETIIARLI
jgi:phosphatidylserine decarboxylase